MTGQKIGSLHPYDPRSIASGYRQKLTLFTGGARTGVAAYSTESEILHVAHPRPFGRFARGSLAFRLDASCQLRLAWQAKAPVSSDRYRRSRVVSSSTPTVVRPRSMRATRSRVCDHSGAESAQWQADRVAGRIGMALPADRSSQEFEQRVPSP